MAKLLQSAPDGLRADTSYLHRFIEVKQVEYALSSLS